VALLPRLAAVIGAGGRVEAFTIFADWRDPARPPPKDRDFAIGLGPVAVTSDDFEPDGRAVAVRVDGRERVAGEFRGFDWEAAVSMAADGTKLYPGDLIAGPAAATAGRISSGSRVEVEIEGVGILEQTVART
jgi:2-keto-4-pentenoate hydratase/2-oxohepta-3-ene-1,7-dioic acid hydratase in catechol pathway